MKSERASDITQKDLEEESLLACFLEVQRIFVGLSWLVRDPFLRIYLILLIAGHLASVDM